MRLTARKDFTLGAKTFLKGVILDLSEKEAKELIAAGLVFPEKVGGQTKESKEAKTRKTK
jgi:hypothetical protein